MKTDTEYLALAYRCAKMSNDPSTQNGAILVDEFGNVVASGWNRFPFGVLETSERWERPVKYRYVEHAERDVLFSAAANGIETYGLTMYCPWYACADCARAIIQCGIQRIVGHRLPAHDENPRWKESIADAMIMLQEAGVVCDYVEGKIGCNPIRMNGLLVSP